MTFDQQQILRNFREELVAEGILHEGDTIGSDQTTLLRFLRARRYNIQLAKTQFRECQEWRQTVQGIGIDELYRRVDPFNYPERDVIFQSWPMWYHKTDKQGRPIHIQVVGEMGMRKLHKLCPPQKHWEAVLVICESLPRELLPAASRAAGKSIEKAFVIVDLKGFGFEQFWQMKSILRGALQISQNYYPDTMGKLVVINAPASFSKIWPVLRRWLSDDTAEKVEILGDNFAEILLEYVDAENLPSTLGGKCTCEEMGGCQYSNAGPWIDGRIIKP
ncbi:SEC14 cytosolic factor [Coprinopsis cinerea AmutBmut pab1-1]|nr:SEC14 cytosolic factor [Coprinopsis cinerea AmutBmut pab1-1]